MNTQKLKQLAELVRYYILISTAKAGSGHPTSSLSAADLMTVLMFGGFFKFDAKYPLWGGNDRIIFSKGHAAPLLYALWAAAGKVSEKELGTLRVFGSPLEGHPSMRFPYTEAATGSLGQGLSIGVGMALNAKYADHLPYRTFVLLGDSEMAEGSVWEAIQLAAHYKLDNLVGILDVNRLGQRGETMYGHDIRAYEKRIAAFGWETEAIDGHDHKKIHRAFAKAQKAKGKPVMVIAKTIKGKGVSFLEDKEGWHGKALSALEMKKALAELSAVDTSLRGDIKKPVKKHISDFAPAASRGSKVQKPASETIAYRRGDNIATRTAYGDALVRIFPRFPRIVVLDAEVSNSTRSDIFKKKHPDRFFEMFIAEQNMVGAALGLSRQGSIPFVSTFAAFFTRAFDQIRMSQYSEGNIKFVGSHGGVSIGKDGPSQMGLEDLALFRTLFGSVVLYPSDAVSADRLIERMAEHEGIAYMRTTRMKTPVMYDADEEFVIGGSKTVKQSERDSVTVIGAGVTLCEALKAHEELQKEGIHIRVIDLYSVKPLDEKTLQKAARDTRALITVEDHVAAGGIGEAVRSAFSEAGSAPPVYSLAVKKTPRSGTPQELFDYEGISCAAIADSVRHILHS